MLNLEQIQEIGKLSWTEYQSFYENAEKENQEEALEILKARCATDLELFAETFFPHYCTRPFNPFHREYFEQVQFGERDVKRVRAAPRGAAKSTLATLIKPIHDACYGLEGFILILSSTTPLAYKKLKDIRNEIDSNIGLRLGFGVRFPSRKAGESEFVVISENGRTYFQALGRGSEVRGIRVHEKRPTKVICDDIEYSDEVYNEKIREKTANWYFEDVSKVGDTGTNFEFVGTVLHRDSLLKKLLKNPSYKGKIFKAILSWSEREDLWEKWREIYMCIDDDDRLAKADAYYEANKDEMLRGTKVLWPEKEDYLAHMKDLAEIGRRAFMKEKQNDPQGEDDNIFTKFTKYEEVADGFKILDSGIIVKKSELECIGSIDPATGKAGEKKKGDFTSILTGYKDLKKRVFVHHDVTKRMAPSKYITEIFELHKKFSYNKFSVETNLYRELLLPNILDEKKRREKETKEIIQIPFYDCEQTENKRERIFRLEPKVNHGWILFNRTLSQEFWNQLTDFPTADHDDAPDCLEQLYSLANNRYKAAAISVNAIGSR